MAALVLFGACCWLVLMLQRGRLHIGWDAGGRLAWWLSVLGAVAFIARGIAMRRPVTARHALAALASLAAGVAAHAVSFPVMGDVLVAAAGLLLMWPTASQPQPEALRRIWALVNKTHGDPLAPFAMSHRKSYHFTADDSAVVAYRVVLGYAVVSGDPIGDADRFRDVVAGFAAMCRGRGWRIVVLGCSERRLALWGDPAVIGQALRPIPFGRDVVISVAGFHMTGRTFRNLRQAVQRTRNACVTTQVVAEADLDEVLRRELAAVVRASPRGARTERGFSMNLDGALLGGYPGVHLIIARDRTGRVQGFHRYAVAGAGSDVTLDSPWRRRSAPNGIDERLSVDMIAWAHRSGARRLSLAFAPFPEIFRDADRGPLQGLFHFLIHLGDPLIRLESLYRYLRKFNAMRARRYVLLSAHHLLPALCAMLILEFVPRRRPVEPDHPVAHVPISRATPQGRRKDREDFVTEL